jgi:alpha-beta hydrolase superfamily lysophospholipase
MALAEIEFKSFNERDTIKAWAYIPIRKPRAVVQILHGLGDHSRRYLHLILTLNEEGFIVCADDHVGHGKTAHDADTWGDFGGKGYMTTTEDEKTLHDLMVKTYGPLPYFMAGHSWGSMIIRNYAVHYGADLDGAILVGTPGVRETNPEMTGELEAEINAGRGNEINQHLLGMFFTGMTDRYENPRTKNDWNSTDPDVVADGLADPFCNIHRQPTNQSLYDFIKIMDAITGKEWAEKVPADLPVYNLGGDQDPIGNFGEGTYKVSNWLAGTGHKNVKTRLYSGHRHEILQDRDIRDEVEGEIVAFINEIIGK